MVEFNHVSVRARIGKLADIVYALMAVLFEKLRSDLQFNIVIRLKFMNSFVFNS